MLFLSLAQDTSMFKLSKNVKHEAVRKCIHSPGAVAFMIHNHKFTWNWQSGAL